MAYKSKFKGKEIDDRLDLIPKLSEDIKNSKDVYVLPFNTNSIMTSMDDGGGVVYINPISISEINKAIGENKIFVINDNNTSEDFGEFVLVQDLVRRTSGEYVFICIIDDRICKGIIRGSNGFLDHVKAEEFTPSNIYPRQHEGIPKEDLSNEVQNALDKAESSIQNSTQGDLEFIQTGGIEGSISGTIYALPTESTEDADDILLSKNTTKTINGQSLFGEGDIPIEGGSNNEYESNIDDKTLAMPNAVGGIAKGTTISALEGKTYNEMFDDLLFPTVNPTFTAPSASIAFKSYSSTQEVGANGPTSANFTTSYSAGEIKLNGVKQANRGGTQNTSNSFIYVNGSTSNKTLPSKVTLGKTTFKYRAAYNQGPQPKNNKGGNYSTPLAAGTVDSSAITLNGTYPWYASTSSATSTNPVIKQSLVAWDTTAGNMSTGQFTVQPSGTLPQVFKLPRKLHTLQLKNALNGQMETVTNVSKDYTESTETINIGGTDVTYYVYTYSGSTRGSVTLLAKF